MNKVIYVCLGILIVGAVGIVYQIEAAKADNPTIKNATPSKIQTTTKQQPVESEENFSSSIKTTNPKEKEGKEGFENQQKEDASLKSLAKITPEQAKASALKAVPGEVTKVTLENENGNVVYSIKIKTVNGNVEVIVDAGNAKVLAKENGTNAKELKKEKETKETDNNPNEVED